MENRTVLSLMAAANMLGVDVEEVKRMFKSGSLEAVDREGGLPGVSLCSVHAFKGEKCPEETQSPVNKKVTKKATSKQGAGRKPNVMTFEAAATYLNTDIAGVKELIEEGVLEVAEGVGGVRGPKEAQVKMYKKKLEGREESAKKKDKEATKPRNSTEDKNGKDEDRKTTSKPFDIDEMMKKLFEGVQLLPKEVREAALGKCKKCEVKYNEHDLKEVASVAYKMGKLAVYESMGEFKRKVQS